MTFALAVFLRKALHEVSYVVAAIGFFRDNRGFP
jgi:hypothetical protein